MKIVEFFLIIWGKWSEPEPEFLTSRSHSRSKWTGSATLYLIKNLEPVSLKAGVE
jgi:hypothetical protein